MSEICNKNYKNSYLLRNYQFKGQLTHPISVSGIITHFIFGRNQL